MPKIEFKDVSFEYSRSRKHDEAIALDCLSAVFNDDTFNVVIGPSGCGKTTLLRLITGFYDEYDGEIFIDNKNADELSVADRRVAYINQDNALYPHLTVFDNIAFPLRAVGASREEIIERVNTVAKQLDLIPTLSRKPRYLSGGQKQRVAIARGLIKNAKIYLFDEPFSNADLARRTEQRFFLKKIVKEHHATAVYVTHDFSEALAIADYIYVMENGKILAYGTPKEIFSSGNEIVESYIKATNFNFSNEKEKQ